MVGKNRADSRTSEALKKNYKCKFSAKQIRKVFILFYSWFAISKDTFRTGFPKVGQEASLGAIKEI